MRSIQLAIRRKTKVPTNKQILHDHRSDWIKVKTIDYNESKRLFSFGHGKIETDSQFCKWIYDNYGKGVYSIIAWRKGRKGFWSFMKIELGDKKFRRLPKNLSPAEIELRQEKQYLKNLERTKSSKRGSERDEAEEEIEDSQETIKDIKGEIKSTKTGCYPYLKSMQPMYYWHSYEDYENDNEQEEAEIRLI